MTTHRCLYGDPHCPCQDGDICHYVATRDTTACAPPDWFNKAKIIARVFTDNGIEITAPDEASLDDVERERWFTCLDAVQALYATAPEPLDEAVWSDDGVLTLFPIYYDQPDRVFNALLCVGDADVEEAEVAAWTSEQRKRAGEWALSVHIAASDNDDVKVPPRPDFIRSAP